MRKARVEPSEVLAQLHTYGVNMATREVYLHSHYGSDEETGVEYRMATTFIKNLHVLEHADARSGILVHMHTVGGEWGDGMAIYDAIQACRCRVVILAYAQASSMSGVIFQAGDRRVMMPNCEFLMHYGSVGVDTHAVAARSLVIWNDSLQATMLRIFSGRAAASSRFAGRPLPEIEAEFDKQMKEKVDWFLNAQEAVEYGLADGILGSKGFESITRIRR